MPDNIGEVWGFGWAHCGTNSGTSGDFQQSHLVNARLTHDWFGFETVFSFVDFQIGFRRCEKMLKIS